MEQTPSAASHLQVLLGQRIREVRQRSGMTQGELAVALTARVGEPVSRSTVGNYETGRRPLPADRLLHIAEVCGVPLQTFALNEATTVAQSTPTADAPPRDDQPQAVAPAASTTSTQALALINQTLQDRPDVIPFVLELIASFVEGDAPVSEQALQHLPGQQPAR